MVAVMPEERAGDDVDLAALVRATRQRQGLPTTIRDPVTLAHVATLLDPDDEGLRRERRPR